MSSSTRWRNTVLIVLAGLLAVAALGSTQLSSAAYTSSSANPRSTASAAVDWTPPRVAVQDPGAPLKGSVTLTASASDAETGIRSISFAAQPREGGAWIELCSTSASPYRCTWDTTKVADGSYVVRAIATDNAGYTSTSTVVTTVVNDFGVLLAHPGDVVRGTVSLSATLLNTRFLAHTVRIEYAPAGTQEWTSICLNLFAPWTCSWNTARLPDGLYDLRAVATQSFTPTAYSVVEGIRVSNRGVLRSGAQAPAATPTPVMPAPTTPAPATPEPDTTATPALPQASIPQTPAPTDPAVSDRPDHTLTETDPDDDRP